MVNNRRGPIKYDESLIKEDHSYKTREKYDYELSKKVERFLKDYGFDFEHGYPVDIIDRPDGKCEVEFEDGLQDRDYGILKRKAKRNPWNFEIVPGREHIHGGLLSVTFGLPGDESVKEAYDDATYLRDRDKYTNKLDGQSDMFRDLGIRNVDIKYFVEPTCFEGTIEKIGPFNEIEDAVEFGRKYEQESPDAQDEDYAGIFITDSNGDIVLDCDETYDIYSNGKQFGESLKESKSLKESADRPVHSSSTNYNGEQVSIELWDNGDEYEITINEYSGDDISQETREAVEYVVSRYGWFFDDASDGEDAVDSIVDDIKREYSYPKNESLKESADKEIDRKGFKSLIKYGVHDDGGNYAVLNDGNFVRKFWADNDDEAKVIFRRGPSRKPELTQDPMAAGQWYESFKGPKPSKSGLKKHNKQ